MTLDIEILKQYIRPIADSQDLELVDVAVKGRRNQPLIQVFVDRTGGISIDECAKLSRQISDILDVEFTELMQYRLEVSSPGADRPLTTENDFRRNIGREVKILRRVEEKDQTAEGTIIAVHANNITIKSNNLDQKIDLNTIVKATLRMKW